jgi:surface antigen
MASASAKLRARHAAASSKVHAMTLSTCTGRLWVVAAFVAAAPAMAGDVSFMKDTPYAYFTKDDHKIFNDALDEMLNKGADGEARSWSNPATQAGGEIKVVSTIQRAGAACRTLSIANQAKDRAASGKYNFCKNSAGKWVLSK